MTLMLAPMISADAIPGAVSWRVKARARPEITLADASRCDVSRCKFVQPFIPVDCVVSETGEADMMVGKITLTIAGGKLDACMYSLFPAIVLADRLRSEKSISRCQELPMAEKHVSV